MPKPWYRVVNVGPSEGDPAKRAARVDIYDEIGGYTDWWTGEKGGLAAKDFVATLAALGTVDEIELHINSPGGSIVDGWVIYNELRRHPAEVTAYIDGQAASMASVIAMAADFIWMPKNATLWVHNPISWFPSAAGNAADMRKAAAEALHLADDLDTFAATIRQTYVDRSKGRLTDSLMAQLMDAETLITAEQAVELGLADALEDPMPAAASFDMAARRAAFSAAVAASTAGANPPPPPDRAAIEAQFADALNQLRAAGFAVSDTLFDALMGAAPAVGLVVQRLEPPMPARDLIAACRDGGVPQLAPDFIEAGLTAPQVAAHIGIAREIANRLTAANLPASLPGVLAAHAQGPAALVGYLLGMRFEDAEGQAAIQTHLPADGRRRTGGNVIDARAIYAQVNRHRR